jgi:hypothetical protein
MVNPISLSPCVCAQGAPSLLARPPPVLRSLLRPHRACCLGEFRLAVNNSGRPSVRPQHLWFVRSALSLFPTQVGVCRRRDSSTSGQPVPPSATPSHTEPHPEVRCPLPHSISPKFLPVIGQFGFAGDGSAGLPCPRGDQLI